MADPTPNLSNVLAAVDADLDAAIARLFELVAIKSISTDPAYAPECRKAAEWLVKDLKTVGFDARVVNTIGHPMVVGHYKGPENAPHVLFYGHYDVQPVDPLNLWKRPPFEPAIETRADGTKILTGRGTADDKGQLMTFVEACRAWRRETGGLPLSVTILFEGEEESGSESLGPFFKEYADEIKADLALVCDTGMWDRETPAITTGLRGLVGEQVVIKAANRDLHSGMYGSAAANPIRVLAKIFAQLHDEDGAVTLPGFYEGVDDTLPEILAMWDGLGFSEADFLGDVGLSVPAGEKDRTVLEQVWARPTCEFNGIWGGYTGDGFKTVIPAEASAKVSFRLVGRQDPDLIRESFREFVQSRLPADCEAVFHEHGGSPAIALDPTMPEVTKAAAALKEEWGRETALTAMGGSVPIVGEFQSELGMNSLMIGFGLDDDSIHSPNEKYELTSFHKGIRSWARVLEALAK